MRINPATTITKQSLDVGYVHHCVLLGNRHDRAKRPAAHAEDAKEGTALQSPYGSVPWLPPAAFALRPRLCRRLA